MYHNEMYTKKYQVFSILQAQEMEVITNNIHPGISSQIFTVGLFEHAQLLVFPQNYC